MSRDPQHLRARRGLTLAELIVGTAMLGIVAMAASGLISAVAAGWKSGETITRMANVRERAGLRIEDAIAPAFHVFQTAWVGDSGGGNGNAKAGVFFWASDGITGVVDGKAQLGEASLILYDKTSKAILLYEAIPRASMTSAQLAAAQQGDWGNPSDPMVVQYWLSQGFVAPPKRLIGGQPGASEVLDATFTLFAPSGAKPVVTYTVSMTQNGLAVERQGTVTMRAAQRPRNI